MDAVWRAIMGAWHTFELSWAALPIWAQMWWVGATVVYLTVGTSLAARWVNKANEDNSVDMHDAGDGLLAFIVVAVLVFFGMVLLWPFVLAIRFLVGIGNDIARTIK